MALVEDGITAMNGRPSSAAKYASDTAVDPDDASMTVVFSLDPAVAQRVQEQRTRQPVLEAAGDVRRLVLEVELHVDAVAPRHRQRIAQQMGVGAAPGVGLDQPDRVVHPRAWLAAS